MFSNREMILLGALSAIPMIAVTLWAIWKIGEAFKREPTPEIRVRPRDLTRYVCADCGNLIEGDYRVQVRDGVRQYVCAGRCEKALADRPLGRVPFPWSRESFEVPR